MAQRTWQNKLKLRWRNIQRPCAMCGELTRRYLCFCCVKDLPLVPAKNLVGLLQVHRSGLSPFRAALAPLWYHHSVPRFIHDIKFRGAVEYLNVVSPFVVAQAIRFYSTHQLMMPQLLIPVPIAPQRLSERGFNQAELIAQKVGIALGIDVKSLVGRQTHQKAAHRMTFNERTNLSLKEFYRTEEAWPEQVSRVAIVDDVMTTGTTLTAVKALLKRKNIIVDCWAVAITPPPKFQEGEV
ncbi:MULTISPECIES: ComF family protein [Gammaproteobacteria]|uniref:ComF family protein n=1 Tax=Gammaproteobacteria TaxID=1236 RepID=UPI000DD074C6|nr:MULTISPECIES: phosphoribosyltransferase family protein [Gammaproteobacteria]RTE86491.1 ComF family protein [Aliidiomarina sp. B3213]TCZ90954.1 ComF family protein [Lysobacter sp. N42]